MAYCLLGFPGLAGIVEHEGHLMAGFIPVPVPVFAEHRVQFLHEVIAPSHALHQSVRVVWHVPRIVAGSSFRNELGKLERVLFFQESAVGMSSLCISGLWVDDVSVIPGACGQHFIVFFFLKQSGHLCEDKVVIRIFQCARHLLLSLIHI